MQFQIQLSEIGLRIVLLVKKKIDSNFKVIIDQIVRLIVLVKRNIKKMRKT